MEPERCVKLLADMGIHAVTGRVATRRLVCREL